GTFGSGCETSSSLGPTCRHGRSLLLNFYNRGLAIYPEFSFRHNLIHVLIGHVQQVRESGFKNRKKFIQNPEGWRPKVFQAGMKIDGVDGNNRWNSPREVVRSQLHVFLNRKVAGRGLDIDGAVEMENFALLEVRGQ